MHSLAMTGAQCIKLCSLAHSVQESICFFVRIHESLANCVFKSFFSLKDSVVNIVCQGEMCFYPMLNHCNC